MVCGGEKGRNAWAVGGGPHIPQGVPGGGKVVESVDPWICDCGCGPVGDEQPGPTAHSDAAQSGPTGRTSSVENVVWACRADHDDSLTNGPPPIVTHSPSSGPDPGQYYRPQPASGPAHSFPASKRSGGGGRGGGLSADEAASRPGPTDHHVDRGDQGGGPAWTMAARPEPQMEPDGPGPGVGMRRRGCQGRGRGAAQHE